MGTVQEFSLLLLASHSNYKKKGVKVTAGHCRSLASLAELDADARC